MQKRGQDHCPMCRAPTVLSANRCMCSLVSHVLARLIHLRFLVWYDLRLIEYSERGLGVIELHEGLVPGRGEEEAATERA